jgi:hypothetical protein
MLDQGLGRHVDNGIDRARKEHSVERGLVAKVRLEELGAWGNGSAMSRLQVIDHDNVVAGADELLSNDAADIAGATRYENPHQ